MAVNVFSVAVPMDRARAGLDAVRAEHGVSARFDPAVLAAADEAISAYRLPELDLTDLALVTLDPASSTDLDQAFCIEPDGTGYRVHYAIADVPAFVPLGGVLDTETRRRGETVYCPDLKASLHPPALADDAASLLPGQVRGAYVWTLLVDDAGDVRLESLRRAAVRSRAKLDYASEQERLEAGQPHPQVALLREVGTRRVAQEVARGAVSLPSASQEVGEDEGGLQLGYRLPVPVEEWNAQLSLMTGMAAARVMLDGGLGVLRTMPPPAQEDLRKVRRSARALDIAWPTDLPYPDLIRTLDPRNPQHAAFFDNVTLLMRGAGYTAFDGAPPELTTHAAIAGPYAHCTAPLRRLVDRFVLPTCLALVEGRDVDAAIRAALPELPELMVQAGRRSRAVERASTDYLEAELLAGREGVAFRGVVIEQRRDDGVVQLADPAIIARCRGRNLPVGEWVSAWLVQADPVTRRVVFDVSPRGSA
ncbi:MAG: RNB domain-containing ribonuclease [Candidatus Nanopelagicales bacterium]|nr:RNB domain-containing ribonuclease [Candidatus Nanopelagicales bacterium]